MFSRDVYFLIGQHLLENDKITSSFLALRSTCSLAKKACDILIACHRNELLYVEYDGHDSWSLYKIEEVSNGRNNWPIINDANSWGTLLVCRYGDHSCNENFADVFGETCGFLMKGYDILDRINQMKNKNIRCK